ncbi:hypothetical protein ASF56_23655 [Methylobacterium sp. Leaf122]|nr:hypothetical protein ASF56_23655 [Methylobacterium sp. Leaf122]
MFCWRPITICTYFSEEKISCLRHSSRIALLGELRLLANERQALALGHLHLDLGQLSTTCSALVF